MQSHKLLLSTTIAVLLVLLSSLLLDRAAPARAGAGTDILGPGGSAQFGKQVLALPNGNIVVADPGYNGNAGAVYLYNGGSAALISALTGGSANDRVGKGGITVLANGNFVVGSPYWGGTAGAATWCSAAAGCNGIVSGLNSLVGTNVGDYVGSAVSALPNGSYVVQSTGWNGSEGAATWGPAAGGVSGSVSAANSMVGSNTGDDVGNIVTVLSNGSYVLPSQSWNGNIGSVTWCSATGPCAGVVSALNSLVGSSAGDYVGETVTPLSNGNYVVASSNWNGNRGADTWGSGTGGITGVVSAGNSFVGAAPGDQAGYVAPLPDGNYVLMDANWNGTVGAATWAHGTTGITGVVSAGNSLLGSNAGDMVGWNLTTLANGNYVLRSQYWNGNRGAVTWGSPNGPLTGTVSAANSLVGSSAGDQVGGAFNVLTLTNGNYVVLSPSWTNGGQAFAGAATWASGASGITGAVSAANSLVGTSYGDNVGSTGVALPNGNYVVASTLWNGYWGEASWGSGTSGITGAVSAANSLVGSSTNDQVGSNVTVLANGNYVVSSYTWNGNEGEATWCSATGPCAGVVSALNSLIGGSAGDYVGEAVTPLSNGNYVVASSGWNGNRGAATWASGTSGITGAVSAGNSLVGSSAGDFVGSVVALANSSYVVLSRNWGGDLGAVTWGSGAGGVKGPISAGNSLVGSSAGDRVGYQGGTALSNGNYVILSRDWAHGVYTEAGAVTLGLGDGTTTGPVTSSNSVLGGVTSGGSGLNWAYDAIHNQIAVGRPAENIVTLFINKAQAAMSLKASSNPSYHLQTVTFTTVLTSALITPTGAVRFYDNGSAVLTVTLAGGRAGFVTSTLSVGTHPITASYGGDLNFAPATTVLSGGQHVLLGPWKLLLPLLRR